MSATRIPYIPLRACARVPSFLSAALERSDRHSRYRAESREREIGTPRRARDERVCACVCACSVARVERVRSADERRLRVYFGRLPLDGRRRVIGTRQCDERAWKGVLSCIVLSTRGVVAGCCSYCYERHKESVCVQCSSIVSACVWCAAAAGAEEEENSEEQREDGPREPRARGARLRLYPSIVPSASSSSSSVGVRIYMLVCLSTLPNKGIASLLHLFIPPSLSFSTHSFNVTSRAEKRERETNLLPPRWWRRRHTGVVRFSTRSLRACERDRRRRRERASN